MYIYTILRIFEIHLLSCKLFKAITLRKPRNTRLLDNNLERRPITIELNLNAVTLCGGESLPVSSLTFDP